MIHNSREGTWRHLLALLALVLAIGLSAGTAFAAKPSDTYTSAGRDAAVSAGTSGGSAARDSGAQSTGASSRSSVAAQLNRMLGRQTTAKEVPNATANAFLFLAPNTDSPGYCAPP